ncbi:MAG TPA: Ig-like domain-containing protein [Gemmatimonadota bacterium]|nr:Ig-like domain-containing protein [Gemmatimonadota bacterium]
MTIAAAACASEGFPPGGPVDEVSPVLVESEPADRAVNAASNQAIRLRFDEPIGERTAGDLSSLILVNPDTPEFDIRLEDETITLSPMEPMVDGATYMVTVLPGLEDREGNRTTGARTILFSTGGERPITLSIVRATIVGDSLPAALAFYHLEALGHELDYTMVADSQGNIEMEGVAYGRYEATAWLERTRPEGWQMTEEPGARDTFELSVEERAHDATYRIAVVDTTAPLIVTVETGESRLFTITLDDALPADLVATAAAVHLWEAEPGLAEAEVPLDSLDPADLRVRRIAISAVERQGPRTLQVVPAEPLRKDRVYRIEVAVENASGVPAAPEGGRTFQPRFEGPAVWPSERIPWPDAEGMPADTTLPVPAPQDPAGARP